MTDRSAEELERDADRIRTGIARTSEELKHRMSPGQMVDEAVQYLRASDGSVALENLRQQVRDNPMPLVLIGAGLGWLLLGSGVRERGYGRASYGPSYSWGDHRFADEPARPGVYGTTASAPWTHTGMGSQSVSERASGMAARAGEAASDASHRAGDVAQWASETGREAADRVSGFAEDASARMRALGHDASDRMGAMAHGASDRIGDIAHEAADRGRYVAHASRERLYYGGRSLMDALEREPLVFGAVGLAVGAAIGAMLPATRMEDEAFGDSRDRLAREAGQALDRAAHAAERAAHDAYAAGHEAAEREGLLPHEGERPLAERVGNVAKAAASAAGRDAEEEARRVGEMGADQGGDQSRRGVGTSPGGPAGTSGTAGTIPPPGSTTGTTAPGSGAGVGPGAAAGMRQQPKTGTDDLASRGVERQRDVGPGGTGPA